MIVYSLVIFAIAVVAGLVPLVAKRNDRLLHLLIAFATGIFLGVVFLHFLPEVARMGAEAAHGEGAEAGHLHGKPDLWIFVLVGVVGLFILEGLVFRGRAHPEIPSNDPPHAHAHDRAHDHRHGHADSTPDHREHTTVGYAVLFGLSVHAFTAGLGLAATLGKPSLAASVFLSIISHKGVEGFSLTTVFMLAGMRLRRTLCLLGAFALVTPVGILLGSVVRQLLDEFGVEVMMALAAGTFLFVALGDLLPEVFHRRIDAVYKVLLLVVGIVVSALVHT